MSSAVFGRQGVLADALVSSTALANTALVIGGAGLTAVMAQLAVPLWPVPRLPGKQTGAPTP
ncbi:MAG: hypothetical protein ACQEXN_12420 [Actinomycetota bacterium]